jgi:hypothetical protein
MNNTPIPQSVPQLLTIHLQCEKKSCPPKAHKKELRAIIGVGIWREAGCLGLGPSSARSHGGE